ncbi:glycerophosphodiester phosphodiesterase [Nonomuraea purpurea]|uniref:Glycerophosphodiester phosphodiesterase n=1 Tax=Nonomuraea purpurea TaxID=1849276 RepID=A0ABV8GQP5_9ACTN
MYRLLGVVITVALILMTRPAQAAPNVDNIAHRGGAGYGPENTIAACVLSGKQGANMCEFDVQQTNDGELVLIHDQTLNRTTNVEDVYPERAPWRVADFTLEEIRRLDAGSWFSSRYQGEGVPTLKQALDNMGGGGPGLLLEIKHSPLNPGIDRRVATELQENRSLWGGKRLVLQAFDWKAVRALHRMLPEVPVVVIGKPGLGQLDELSGYAKGITLPHSGLTPDYISKVHDRGMRVYTSTANRRPLIRRLIAYGVDGIMTNRPDRVWSVKRRW